MRRVAWFIAVAALIFPQLAKAECTLVSSGETRPTGTIIHNVDHNVLQACTNDGTWQALTPVPDPCDPAQSPTPGTTCGDGSVYAGLSPDGNVPMYTTPVDDGIFYFGNGQNDWVDTSMENCDNTRVASSCNTGKNNTAVLLAEDSDSDDSGIQEHQAAAYCDALFAHGHDDWYLPAAGELQVLYENQSSIPNFNPTNSYPDGCYVSSSEMDPNQFQRPSIVSSECGFPDNFKNDLRRTRCVRR